ncbi:MAG TPA: GAF domain-containing protein [Candidatus Dormibacteraeota bacterium]
MRSESLPVPEGGDVAAVLAAIAGHEDDEGAALAAVAEVIARRLGWPVGHALTVDTAGALLPSPGWYLADPARFEPFRAVSEAEAAGQGVLGRVHRERAPVWVEEVAADPSFLRRRTAALAGLVAGAVVPILAGGEMAGILELFTDDAAAVTDLGTRLRLLELSAHAGEALASARAQRRERERERRVRAVFDGPVPMATLDTGLRIVDANAALSELVGVEQASLAGWEVDSLGPPRGDLGSRLRAALRSGDPVVAGVMIATVRGAMPAGIRAWPVAGSGAVAHVLLIEPADERFATAAGIGPRLERRQAALEAVRDAGNEATLLAAIATAARDLLGCDAAVVSLSGAGARPFATLVGSGLTAAEDAVIGSLGGALPGLLGALAVEDRPMRISDIRSHPAHTGPELFAGRRALLGVPLRTSREGTIGHLVALDRAGGEPFDDLDEALAIDFAAVSAGLVVHARAGNALQGARAHVRRLAAANIALLQQVRPADVLQAAVDLARSVTDAEYAALLLVEPATGSLTRFVHAGLTPAAAARIGPLPSARGLLRALMLAGRPIRLADLRRHPAHAGFPPGHPAMRSLVAVPLSVQEAPHGLLLCANHLGGEFDEADEASAVQVAAAVERSLTHEDGRGADDLIDQLAVVSRRLRENEAVNWRFLGTLSHELRSSLSGILMSADLLADATLGVVGTTAALDVAGRIGVVAHNLMALVDNLLDLSRIQARRLEVRLQPVDLAPLLRDARSTIEPLAVDAGVALDIPDGEGEPRLLADPVRLRQVILNLLTNAVKFTPAGGRAWIELESGEHDLTIAVCDTGTGIEEADHERIFEPFERIEGSSAPGTGLGLAIARAIVELHGGRLTVSSWPGVGSRFGLTVRLARNPHLGPELTEALEEHRAVVTDDGRGRSLLLVEDDEASRESTTTVLELAGYHVDAVATCAEAVRAFAEGAHEVVLLDAQLPDGNGLDIVPRLRELAAGRMVRVVTFSADRIGDTEERATAECDDFILKPLRPRELLRRLRALLEA